MKSVFFLQGSSLIWLALLSVISCGAMGAQSVSLEGRWKNQRGSILEVKQEGNKLSGTFATAVAKTNNCINYPSPVIGYTNGNASSISISMEGCGSPVTISMSGILMEDKQGVSMLKTQSLVQDKGDETWDSQILCTDFYYRLE